MMIFPSAYFPFLTMTVSKSFDWLIASVIVLIELLSETIIVLEQVTVGNKTELSKKSSTELFLL